MQAPCPCPQPPGQKGQPNYALSHSIPQTVLNTFIPTEMCKGPIKPGKIR